MTLMRLTRACGALLMGAGFSTIALAHNPSEPPS